ncbi:MAG: KH domain-containing protein [Spirochaetia bacterium]|nr:KH domain-containing protein [Spirochaetia bacterium]MBR4437124.1 KH domain-containing protein [Spirochaetales bacterium]MBQ3647862.1 KH domain-containing protein [Spirochaetia bacterium]MBQ3713630.1 KH domain-containing protein [Spirochaetia bacterium]MBQ6673663.1 KH domain-containing protein [Spirochaetia bacterium]
MEKDLVEYIAKSLVDDPENVSVSIIEGEKSTILELRVSQDDIGKVIGKHGRIAKAVRTVLSAAASKTGKRVVLEILD